MDHPNQVDTSPETVDSEWARITSEHEAQPEPSPEAVQEQHAAQMEKAGAAEEDKAKIASVVIQASLGAFEGLLGVDVPEVRRVGIADALGLVIAKRFEGGIFEFLARYKDELAVLSAGAMYYAAVRESIKAQKAKDVSPKKPEKPKEGAGDADATD